LLNFAGRNEMVRLQLPLVEFAPIRAPLRMLQLKPKRLFADPSTPKVPFFIGGQSMGALIASHAVIEHQDWFQGLVLCSPAMDVDKGIVLKIQSLLGAPLEALAPWARLVPAVRVEDMSECEQVCLATQRAGWCCPDHTQD
jgi:alpha-beta hydrolase superfamily lysophospholipase